MGVVTSLGRGLEENWAALTAGRSGIRSITRFPVAHLRTTMAGMIDFLKADPHSGAELSYLAASMAAEEAIAMAGIGSAGNFPGPLYAATPPVEMEWSARRRIYQGVEAESGDAYMQMAAERRTANDEDEYLHTLFGFVAGRLAERFGTSGAPIALSTACASGATAIQLGVEAIRRGDSTAALCVGTDCSVNAEAVIRFSLLSALSSANENPEEASKPFSKNRDGFVIAEGAAALVLEDYDAAIARGAKVLAVMRGVAEKADDFHRTRSKPDGSAIIGAIRASIEDAGLSPDAIDYVNAHGTGTPENDKMEAMALEAVLGERARRVPVSSNKSMIGHTLSAAGALEAAITIATLRNGVIPPTINHRIPDPAIDLDVVPNVARTAQVSVALSNSFGFGGQNACLVIAAEPG
jgi:3-oxoacyl-[acyl-carrier-protein] synthase II